MGESIKINVAELPQAVLKDVEHVRYHINKDAQGKPDGRVLVWSSKGKECLTPEQFNEKYEPVKA